MAEDPLIRRLDPQWNHPMIAASIAISLLGAFTSTQLMCQARMSLQFSSVFVWTLLASLTFGFCSIWSLHEVAMLACELDLPIGIDVPLTILSAVLAVFFTFAALASDLLWNRYTRGKKKRARKARKVLHALDTSMVPLAREASTKTLLRQSEQEQDDELSEDGEDTEAQSRFDSLRRSSFDESDNITPYRDDESRTETPSTFTSATVNGADTQPTDLSPDNVTTTSRPFIAPLQSPMPQPDPLLDTYEESASALSDSVHGSSRRSSSYMGSSASSYGLSNMINTAYKKGTSTGKNAFLATAETLYHGLTLKNIIKGLLWSLAITSMHYVGIAGLRIPRGYFVLSPFLVILSALISWVVCLMGCILMAHMETHLPQQFLFSFVATAGVAAMHFTGKKNDQTISSQRLTNVYRNASCYVLVGFALF